MIAGNTSASAVPMAAADSLEAYFVDLTIIVGFNESAKINEWHKEDIRQELHEAGRTRQN